MNRCSPLPVCLALWAGAAGAALVERDWSVAGDGALTYDTATGLEWLDVTATAGLSYNQVFAQLGPGGAYEGFSFASGQQATDLFAAVGLQEFPGGTSSEGGKIETLLGFIGVTWDLGTGERTEFLTAETEGLASGRHWAGRLYWLEIGMAGAAVALYDHDDNFTASGIGSALVRQASPVTVDGDVNGDSSVDTGDLLLVQRIVLGGTAVPGHEPARADFYPPGTPDGIIGVADYVLFSNILQ